MEVRTKSAFWNIFLKKISSPVAFLRFIFGCGGSLLLWAFL